MNKYSKLMFSIIAVFLTVHCLANEIKKNSDKIQKIIITKANTDLQSKD